MSKEDISKFVHQWVKVTTSLGDTIGFLDDVGLNQHEDKIMITNGIPMKDVVQRNRTIKVENILSIALSTPGQSNF